LPEQFRRQENPSEQHLELELEWLKNEWRALMEKQEALVSSHTPETLTELEEIHSRLRAIVDREWEIQQALVRYWSDKK